jgi:hypothetical protein
LCIIPQFKSFVVASKHGKPTEANRAEAITWQSR